MAEYESLDIKLEECDWKDCTPFLGLLTVPYKIITGKNLVRGEHSKDYQQCAAVDFIGYQVVASVIPAIALAYLYNIYC